MEQDCNGLGATVCEIQVNKPLASKAEAKEYNMNEDVVPNIRLNFSNGTLSDFWSGTYYALVSKFNNRTFTNNVLCNVSCQFYYIEDFFVFILLNSITSLIIVHIIYLICYNIFIIYLSLLQKTICLNS